MNKDMQQAKKEWREAVENLRIKAAKNPPGSTGRNEYTAVAKAFEDLGKIVHRFFDRNKRQVGQSAFKKTKPTASP